MKTAHDKHFPQSIKVRAHHESTFTCGVLLIPTFK